MEALLSVVIALGVILVSMVLHELAHGFVAYKLGDDTAKVDGRLTLNPLKHLDPILSIAMPLLLLLTGGPVFGGAKPVPVDSRKLALGNGVGGDRGATDKYFVGVFRVFDRTFYRSFYVGGDINVVGADNELICNDKSRIWDFQFDPDSAA